MVVDMNLLKVIASNIGIAFVLLMLVDLSAYFFMPADYYLKGYRSQNTASRGPIGGFPRYYFKENTTRGFDISPASTGVTVMNSSHFPIEANEFGCRDQRFSFDPQKPLIYAAGDSQTWGIVPATERWTSVFEKKSGIQVLNCGVPGTAQRHQNQKYRDVIRLLKRRPDLVLVAYVFNDVMEDHTFPTYTVVSGFLVQNHTDPETLGLRTTKEIARLNNPSLGDRVKTALNINRFHV
jgi:hypothetical protein